MQHLGVSNKHAHGFSVLAVAVLILVLGGFYAAAFSLDRQGWGYAGHGGYHRGPSFFYWGGPDIYNTPGSVRQGSMNGPRGGGGIDGGK
jgi:hypothetical protein